MITYEIVDAEPLDIYLGTCKKCLLPKREIETGYPLAEWADKHFADCAQCGGNVSMERVYGVEMGMSCDDRCTAATGPNCNCGCGGVNHGGIWSEVGEVLARALKQYRATMKKREMTAQRRHTDKEAAQAEAFRTWCDEEPQCALVDYLREYAGQVAQGTEQFRNPFLDSLVEWLTKHKPLTEKQLEAGMHTMQRRLYAAAKESEMRRSSEHSELAAKKAADRSASRGSDALVVGVFRKNGETYVVKPNRAGTSSYANKQVMLPHTDRQSLNGEAVKWEFEYCPGILSELTEEDRLSDEDINDWMVKYRRCIVCHHPVKRDRSATAMMGKTCATKMGIKW